jgi:hypothetical protein
MVERDIFGRTDFNEQIAKPSVGEIKAMSVQLAFGAYPVFPVPIAHYLIQLC